MLQPVLALPRDLCISDAKQNRDRCHHVRVKSASTLFGISAMVGKFDRPSSLFLLNSNLLYLTVGASYYTTTRALLNHNWNRVTSAGTTLIGQLGSCVQARNRLDNSHSARHRHIAFLYPFYQEAIRSLHSNN
jgi:hypothetical protein